MKKQIDDITISEDVSINTLYIELNKEQRKSSTQKFIPFNNYSIIVDFDNEDNIIGIEILGKNENSDHR